MRGIIFQIYKAIQLFKKKIFDLAVARSEAHGIFSPYCSVLDLWLWHVGSNSLPGFEPRPLALGVWSVSHWTTRDVPETCATVLMWEIMIQKCPGNWG